MKRSGPLKRHTRLRHRSARRAQREAAQRALRDDLLRTRAYCEASGWLGLACSVPRVVHHRLRRSQGGSDAPGNLLVLCTRHHDAVHANPRAAIEAGLLRRRYSRRLL